MKYLNAWSKKQGFPFKMTEWDADQVEMAHAEVRDLTAADYGLADGAFDPAAMARGRAIVDFVAALTDGQAVGLLDALSGRSRQLWTDAFVL